MQSTTPKDEVPSVDSVTIDACWAECKQLQSLKVLPEEAAFCISDPNKKDCPLTFASNLFVEQTGFPLEDIIGKNCRFLQGTSGTSDDVVRDMSKFLKSCVGKTSQELEAYEASKGAEPRFFLVVNARKDGSEFLNLVHMIPIYGSNDELSRFAGVQYGVALSGDDGDLHALQGSFHMDKIQSIQEDGVSVESLANWYTRDASDSEDVAAYKLRVAEMQMTIIHEISKRVDWGQLTKLAEAAEPEPEVQPAGATMQASKQPLAAC